MGSKQPEPRPKHLGINTVQSPAAPPPKKPIPLAIKVASKELAEFYRKKYFKKEK